MEDNLKPSRTKRYEHEPTYDSFLYPAAAGPADQRLFAPLQGVGLFQTNLIKDGSLSGHNEFKVMAIRFVPDIEADPRDVADLCNGRGELWLNKNRYANFHNFDLPGGVGIHLNSEQGGLVAAIAHRFASNGLPAIHNIRVLEEPFVIEGNESIYWDSEWPAAFVPQAAVRYWLYLDGVELKPTW